MKQKTERERERASQQVLEIEAIFGEKKIISQIVPARTKRSVSKQLLISTQSAFANAKCVPAVDKSIGDKQISMLQKSGGQGLPEWEKIKPADSTIDAQL